MQYYEWMLFCSYASVFVFTMALTPIMVYTVHIFPVQCGYFCTFFIFIGYGSQYEPVVYEVQDFNDPRRSSFAHASRPPSCCSKALSLIMVVLLDLLTCGSVDLTGVYYYHSSLK